MTRFSQSGVTRTCISSFIILVEVVGHCRHHRDRLGGRPLKEAEEAFGRCQRVGGRNFRGRVYPGVAAEVHRLLRLLGLGDWWEVAADDDADDVRPEHRGVWLALLADSRNRRGRASSLAAPGGLSVVDQHHPKKEWQWRPSMHLPARTLSPSLILACSSSILRGR